MPNPNTSLRAERILIPNWQAAFAFLLAANAYVQIITARYTQIVKQSRDGTEKLDEAMRQWLAGVPSLTETIPRFCKDQTDSNRVEAEESARRIAGISHSILQEMLAVYRHRGEVIDEPEIVAPETPPDAAVLAERFKSIAGSCPLTSVPNIKRRIKSFSDNADPIFIWLGFPALSSVMWVGFRRVEDWEAQGRRIHPPLNILEQRSFFQLIAKISTLTNIQPSEIKSLTSPEQLAGIIDVALSVEAGVDCSQIRTLSPDARPNVKSKANLQKDRVIQILGKLRQSHGLQAKEIIDKLPKNLRVGESTLRRHVLSPLSKSGKIVNTAGIGYHLPH